MIMDIIVSFFVDNLTLISIFVTLLSIIVAVIAIIQSNRNSRKLRKEHEKEYEEATKNLTLDIEGKWYSAEFDLKYGIKKKDWANAILEIEVIRSKCGNELEIVSRNQLNESKRETAWNAKGRVITENTLSLDWKSKIEGSTRYGNCFMQFLDFQRGIGYWIGYASSEDRLPVYGYWILSKNREDVIELAELALNKFTFVNVKDLVQKKV